MPKRTITPKSYSESHSGVGHYYLYDAIEQYGGVSAREFNAEVTALAMSNTELVIHLNSPGGSIFEGVAMMATIQRIRKTKDVTIEVDGLAASMAFYLLFAVPKSNRKMSNIARTMAHGGSVGVWGNSTELKEAAELLDSLNEDMISTVLGETTLDELEVRSWFTDGKDHWFTASEMLRMGLIGEIVQVTAGVEIEEEVQDSYQLYTSFAAALTPHHQESVPMKLIIGKLGLAENASEKDVIAQFDAINTAKANAEKRVGELESALAEAEKKAQADRAAALVDAAVDANKIGKGQAERFKSLAVVDYDNTKAILDSLVSKQSLHSRVSSPDSDPLADYRDKSFQELHKTQIKGRPALEVIKQHDPDLFAQIYQDKFGKAPQA